MKIIITIEDVDDIGKGNIVATKEELHRSKPDDPDEVIEAERANSKALTLATAMYDNMKASFAETKDIMDHLSTNKEH
jgi:hypothetical protein